MNPATIVEMLLSNLWPLLPFRIVRADDYGARWTWGTNGETLAPGFHWVWYVANQYERVSRGVAYVDLPTQSAVTTDDYAVCYSANIGWRVVDPVKFWEEVDDVEKSLKALAATHLSKNVRKRKYVDVVKDLDRLEVSLRTTLQTQCNEWGVKIVRVGFSDFVPVAQQVRLFQDANRADLG